MAFENLFIRTKKSIAGIQLDATLSESHTNTVRMTKNPIELGADVTDHVIIEPKRVSITAQVSDTPLGTAAFAQIVDNVSGLFGSSTEENVTRSIAAYNSLIAIQEIAEPIEVQTKLKLYTNMIIVGISTVQDKDSSRIVLMVITLEEALITASEIVQLSSEQLQLGSITEQASPSTNRGRQETVSPDDTTNTSVLKNVLGWLGD